MLKLNGQTESGESYRIKCDHCGQCFDTDVVGVFARCDNCQTEVQINVQSADDPRKQMLEEVRKRVKDFGEIDEYVLVATFNAILDEMEAKL